VISIAPDLDAEAYAFAAEYGPPSVAAPAGYDVLLAETGWRVTAREDISREYGESIRAFLAAERANETELIAAMGAGDCAETLERRAHSLRAAENGWLRRDLFAAVPAD